MYLLIAGVGLMLLKYFEIGFVAELSWWWVLSPFAMAMAWWAWADSTGYTKRKEMEKMDQKKQDRIERQRQALGMKSKRR
ncbi:MAG: TIGR04438 family Trp-rich protein [Gammaproteobacteria bacterium]|nr:TIGR04438 family Trp-rich protein [Gammaproteobacteria bacterium]